MVENELFLSAACTVLCAKTALHADRCLCLAEGCRSLGTWSTAVLLHFCLRRKKITPNSDSTRSAQRVCGQVLSMAPSPERPAVSKRTACPERQSCRRLLWLAVPLGMTNSLLCFLFFPLFLMFSGRKTRRGNSCPNLCFKHSLKETAMRCIPLSAYSNGGEKPRGSAPQPPPARRWGTEQ